MKIEGTNSSLINTRNVPQVTPGGASDAAEAVKTIGETPPQLVSMEQLGILAELFAPGGVVSKLKRRLNKLNQRQCTIVPARGTIACIDDNDQVYVGVEPLLQLFFPNGKRAKTRKSGREGQQPADQQDMGASDQDASDTAETSRLHEYSYDEAEIILAGILSHEWGHSLADRPKAPDLAHLNWDQIFAMRREHEVLADHKSGQMLALMGYAIEPYEHFMNTALGDTHNHKYHDKQTRIDIVKAAYKEQLRKIDLANQLFPSSTYRNHFHSKIVDDEV